MTMQMIDRFKAVVSRRQVMIGAAGLTFAIVVDGGCKSDAAGPVGEARGVSLSPWASIAPDGTISVMSPATEMGQGSMTSLSRARLGLLVGLFEVNLGPAAEPQVVALAMGPITSTQREPRSMRPLPSLSTPSPL
jgi:hypothetical protein